MSSYLSRKASIGVFDSGFGGIDILKGIVEVLPEYAYVYLGDTARTPYGSRSPDVVYEFTRQGVEFLFSQGCSLVIIACNTASADALRRIQQEYLPAHHPERRVLGVLIPAAQEAVSLTKNKKIGVLATEGTVRSGAFVRELHKLEPTLQIFQEACPLLAPIVEAGEERSLGARFFLTSYLKPLLEQEIDTLVLGCTHYGFLLPTIRQIVGERISIISEAPVVAEKLRSYLTRHPEMERHLARDRQVSFYTTDLTERFQILGSRFFGAEIDPKKAQL